jgi:hypothetical protein
MVVMMNANEEGVAKLVVMVGQSVSKPLAVIFRQMRPHPQLLLKIGGVLGVAVVCLALLLGSRRHWEGLEGPKKPRARPGVGRGKRGLAPYLTERLMELKEEDLSESGLDDHKVYMIKRHHLVLHSKIARGAFGNVFKGSWLGTVCAVKQVCPRSRRSRLAVAGDTLVLVLRCACGRWTSGRCRCRRTRRTRRTRGG